MVKNDSLINDDIIKTTIEKDGLGRNKKLFKLVRLLNGIEGNCIISLNGKWGTGKTFFLKQLEYINKNNIINNAVLNSDVVEEFKKKYDVYYYDSWANDYHSSPLLSLIYNLINDFSQEKNQTASGKIELPFNLSKCLKTISQDFIDLDKVKSFKDITEEIYTVEEKKEALINIINNILPNDKKLIFIIDELDRCKPSYAVELLEVIKHYYSNNRIIFLLGTNNEQLSYTISKYYGTNFDGYSYLNKIYDLIIELSNIDSKMYLNNVLNINESSRYTSYSLFGTCNYFNFSMREINRLSSDFNILEQYFNSSYCMYNDDIVVKYIFLPYCLGLKIRDRVKLQYFLDGKNIDDLKEYILSSEKILSIAERYYKNNYTKRKNNVSEITNIDIADSIIERYNEYFVNEIKDYDIRENKEMFIDVFSLLV